MSEEAFREMSRAKKENYQLIYGASEVSADFSSGVRDVFLGMYDRVYDDLSSGREDAPVFRHHIRVVSDWLSHYGKRYAWEDDLDLTTVDYLSSMTDDYFVAYASALYPHAASIFPTYSHF